MKVIELPRKEQETEELQTFEEGDYVEHVDEGPGVVAGVLTEQFDWPDPEDDEETIDVEASEDDAVYIVALLEGGSLPAEASEIDAIDGLPGDGEDVESPEDVESQAEDTELSPIYGRVDDPNSYEELQRVKKELIFEEQATHLGKMVDAGGVTLEELDSATYEELLNIPGVDDPEVGFASDPPGWTRKSYLQAYATVGGTWRSCFARMIRHFGPHMSKRWCAALKDEVLQTERWRNRF